jgi:hypothetical protein
MPRAKQTKSPKAIWRLIWHQLDTPELFLAMEILVSELKRRMENHQNL